MTPEDKTIYGRTESPLGVVCLHPEGQTVTVEPYFSRKVGVSVLQLSSLSLVEKSQVRGLGSSS